MANREVKFEFTPEENEQIEATIIVPQETRSVIHGVVKDLKNCIIKNAVVKLFKVSICCEKYRLKPIGHTFTDESGEFLFGPLCSKENYVIKVWVNDIKIKELIVKPDIDDFCYKDNDSLDTCIDCGYVKKDKRKDNDSSDSCIDHGHAKKDKYKDNDSPDSCIDHGHEKKHKRKKKSKKHKSHHLSHHHCSRHHRKKRC